MCVVVLVSAKESSRWVSDQLLGLCDVVYDQPLAFEAATSRWIVVRRLVFVGGLLNQLLRVYVTVHREFLRQIPVVSAHRMCLNEKGDIHFSNVSVPKTRSKLFYFSPSPQSGRIPLEDLIAATLRYNPLLRPAAARTPSHTTAH
ncbi:hypothetical protein F511_06464 [Dorcoceras hygrometricum]|uniref:Uncharacterized protein n=1 Tax=Dorcoceras hygrometricum TaxID=472368 RepID=A0A2Z7DDE4_9LAMI|nr:hypothetical protein F511_06464 [Dorcoceras hygrometricum]